MNFGKYVIIEAKKYYFELEPELYWEIKAPTSGDELAVTNLFNRGRVTVGYEGTTREAPPSAYEVAYLEIALTFKSTNLSFDDEHPILEPGASVEEVQDVLRRLPHAIVLEIWRAVGDMVIAWGPEPPAEEVAEGEESPNPETQD